MTRKTHKTTIKTCEPTTERQNVHIDKHDRREMPNNYKETQNYYKETQSDHKALQNYNKKDPVHQKKTQDDYKGHQ